MCLAGLAPNRRPRLMSNVRPRRSSVCPEYAAAMKQPKTKSAMLWNPGSVSNGPPVARAVRARSMRFGREQPNSTWAGLWQKGTELRKHRALECAPERSFIGRKSELCAEHPKTHWHCTQTERLPRASSLGQRIGPCAVAQSTRPNPSVNATANGMAPGPRSTGAYHVLRGPGAMPSSARYLKR